MDDRRAIDANQGANVVKDLQGSTDNANRPKIVSRITRFDIMKICLIRIDFIPESICYWIFVKLIRLWILFFGNFIFFKLGCSKPNQELVDYSSTCEETCESYSRNDCGSMYRSKKTCRCKKGYVRDHARNCISKTTCRKFPIF